MTQDTHVVRVNRRFQRSVRIDTDLHTPAALSGFVAHGTGVATLEAMCSMITTSGQRAFTWTGPYGGGKSSLALALAASVSPNITARTAARAALSDVNGLADGFSVTDEGWLVIPVVGRRADPVSTIRSALEAAIKAAPGRARTKRRREDPAGQDVIERLASEAAHRPENGVLLIIDEMGKFLEGAASHGGDIHFFQELAEAAGRTGGKLVVLGVLHQAFEQYAGVLGANSQQEWAKIQGRFVDQPVVTAMDEVISLIGHAIETEVRPKENMRTAEAVTECVARRRPGTPDDLSERLDECWPLHPVVASLLGPVSRRGFAQNERSIFGFLTSLEPEGFSDFLSRQTSGSMGTYSTARLWDYLRLNLEPSILASPDAHRWAQAVDAVERTEARGDNAHLELVKSIALLDLFRNGSGLMPESGVLAACLPTIPQKDVEARLAELDEWSVAIFRKHKGSWALFSGSDFDLEAALAEERRASEAPQLGKAAAYADLQPLLAKRHYAQTGTLRWFVRSLVDLEEAQERSESFASENGEAGAFLLAIPNGEMSIADARGTCVVASRSATTYPVAVGLPPNAWLLRELTSELEALERIRATRPELEGDAVARREIAGLITATEGQLEEAFRSAFASAAWYHEGTRISGDGQGGLADWASKLADMRFPATPVIKNELVNREKPSSNSQAGVRQLLYAMVNSPAEANLGIEGFPTELGIYCSVLENTGLHGAVEGVFKFSNPSSDTEVGKSLVALWEAAEERLSSTNDPVPLSEIYDIWRAPPFGVRGGLLPILGLAFMQANAATTAIYVKDAFTPTIDELTADLMLQNSANIALRQVSTDGARDVFISELAKLLSEIDSTAVPSNPLSVARQLVRAVMSLPAWTRRTTSVSEDARRLCQTLVRADDPHRLLFVDVPMIFDLDGPKDLAKGVVTALLELKNAYTQLLEDLQNGMLEALGQRSGVDLELARRASTVKDLTGDLRLNAFAARLMEHCSDASRLEAIASLAINKPPRDWSDRDPDAARLALAELSLRFRQAEALAGVKGRKPTQLAMAVVLGTGEEGETVTHPFAVPEIDKGRIEKLAAEMLRVVKSEGVDAETVLAALAIAGVQTIEDLQSESNRADSDKVMAS